MVTITAILLITTGIVNTLETSDDSFNDLVDNMLPDQLLQRPNSENVQVGNWINQIDVLTSNITTPVVRVSDSRISNYIGLYFIIEKPTNISAGIKFLHHHVRILNRFLSKVQTLSFIAGVAHVPPLPTSLANVRTESFSIGTRDKLTDILKDRHFDAIVVIFVFFQRLSRLEEVKISLCQDIQIPTVYWRYNDKHPNINGDDYLWQGIVRFLGGCDKVCSESGKTIDCENFDETPAKSLPDDLLKCLDKNVQEKGNLCTKKVPEYVLIPVCGNGIVEDTEGCDCLVLSECGSQCDTNCKPIENATYRYFILVISALIILFIIMMSSLYIFVYSRKLNTYESRASVISIIAGESKLELNAPKSKVKSKLETIQINKAKLKPEKPSSKTQIELSSSKTDSSKTLDTKKSHNLSLKSISKSRVTSTNVTKSSVLSDIKSSK